MKNFDFTSNFSITFLEIRVSSHKIKSDLFKEFGISKSMGGMMSMDQMTRPLNFQVGGPVDMTEQERMSSMQNKGDKEMMIDAFNTGLAKKLLDEAMKNTEAKRIESTDPNDPETFKTSTYGRITDEEMLKNVQKLNNKGFKVAIDILGEHVETEKEADEITQRYISIYDEISKRNLSANISIKLTHIGQDLGLDIVKNNLTQLVQAAKKNNNFLRLDMENVPYTSETIQLYKEMFEHYNQIGIVIQAYLHRSFDDIKSLSDEKFNVRICKGIYVENPELVLNDYDDIRQNFIRLFKEAINNGSYVGIATHDEFLIDNIYSWIIKILLFIDNLLSLSTNIFVPSGYALI